MEMRERVESRALWRGGRDPDPARTPVACSHHNSPAAQDATPVAEGNPQDHRVVSALNGLPVDVAGGAFRVRDEAGEDDKAGWGELGYPGLSGAAGQLLLEGAHGIKDIDHLPASVGLAERVGLRKKAMRRDHYD